MAPILVILGVPIISILVTVGIHRKDAMNAYLMGFFRDVSRIKSTKRHMKQNPNAMVTTTTAWDIVLQRDDPLAGIDFSSTDNTNDDSTISSLATFTVKELEELGNGRNGSKIYLSVFGRVYDVGDDDEDEDEDEVDYLYPFYTCSKGLCIYFTFLYTIMDVVDRMSLSFFILRCRLGKSFMVQILVIGCSLVKTSLVDCA